MKNKEHRLGSGTSSPDLAGAQSTPDPLYFAVKSSSTSHGYATTQRLDTRTFLMILETNGTLHYILKSCALSPGYPQSKNRVCRYSGKGTPGAVCYSDSQALLLNTSFGW